MTRYEQLNKWLSDRQRKYADGLELFRQLAPEALTKKYLSYFEKPNFIPSTFDPHFTMLVNKLSDIDRSIKTSPEVWKKAFEEVLTRPDVVMADEDRKKVLLQKQEKVNELNSIVQELTGKITDLEDSESDKDTEIDVLREQLDDREDELQKLREEINALGKPGIKIVKEADLPPSLKIAYTRIQEITPLYARLHAEISNPDITDEERKKKAEECCNLDDERRKYWRDIDRWAEGKDVELNEGRPEFSNNPVVRGMELERQINRIKQNIHNSKAAVERAEKDGKQTVMQNALERIAKYEQELVELEKMIAGEPGTVQ